jgi:hypothetical protein
MVVFFNKFCSYDGFCNKSGMARGLEVPSFFMWTVAQELAGGPTLKTHLNINSHAKHEGFRLPCHNRYFVKDLPTQVSGSALRPDLSRVSEQLLARSQQASSLRTKIYFSYYSKSTLSFSGELRMRTGVTQSFSSFAPYLQEDRLNKESLGLGLSSSCTNDASETTERDFRVAEQGAHPVSDKKVGLRPLSPFPSLAFPSGFAGGHEGGKG